MLTLTQFFHMNQEVTLKETLTNTDLKDSSYEDINQASFLLLFTTTPQPS